MKENNNLDLNPDSRVRAAINNSMEIYLTKLDIGFYDIGLEDTLKMHLANIISKELDQHTYYIDERFIVNLEKNIEINGNKDYVDIVIDYQRKAKHKLYLIELKFKKITDSAPDLGNLFSYIDIYNLDYHCNKTKDVANCYFIFLTDLETYTKEGKGTRAEIPMHDGYTIQKEQVYNVTNNSARKKAEKYQNGFSFHSNYKIEYLRKEIKGKNYWYYILEIKKHL